MCKSYDISSADSGDTSTIYESLTLGSNSELDFLNYTPEIFKKNCITNSSLKVILENKFATLS